MFGLTRREQRWKAEQQAAELLMLITSVSIRAAADVRIAEANSETERLRAEVERLRSEQAKTGAAP